jgi:hypothetical protein
MARRRSSLQVASPQGLKAGLGQPAARLNVTDSTSAYRGLRPTKWCHVSLLQKFTCVQDMPRFFDAIRTADHVNPALFENLRTLLRRGRRNLVGEIK